MRSERAKGGLKHWELMKVSLSPSCKLLCSRTSSSSASDRLRSAVGERLRQSKDILFQVAGDNCRPSGVFDFIHRLYRHTGLRLLHTLNLSFLSRLLKRT